MAKFTETEIKGVYIIEPRVFNDDRGYFFESYNKKEFDLNIGNIDFIQDNQSKSTYGTLRGIHFQKPPFAQSKLVRVISGKVLDVAVDLRSDSETFLKHVAVELSAENQKQLFLPKGFGHAFIVLSEEAIFAYKVDNWYSKESEGGVRYDDKTLNIDWTVPADKIVVSSKDANLPRL